MRIWFQIYNGSRTDEAMIGKYCGSVNKLDVLSVLVLFVEFISDGSINGRGFNATYSHLPGMSLLFCVLLSECKYMSRNVRKHYENKPIQIYRKFHLQKLKIFR